MCKVVFDEYNCRRCGKLTKSEVTVSECLYIKAHNAAYLGAGKQRDKCKTWTECKFEVNKVTKKHHRDCTPDCDKPHAKRAPPVQVKDPFGYEDQYELEGSFWTGFDSEN